MDLNEGSLFQKRKKDPESPGPEAPDVHPSGAVRAEADSGVGGQPVQPVGTAWLNPTLPLPLRA